MVDAWRECVELAWEAFAARTVPVGSVIVDAAGEVLARGRNRIFEDVAPDGQLFGTRLAHAEVNALGQLSSGCRWDGCTLYSSLEPCALCVGASLISTIGRVRYLVDDPIAGGLTVVRVPLVRPRGELVVEGPAGGELAGVAEALFAAFVVTIEDDEVREAFSARLGPALERGRALVAAGAAEIAAAGASLEEALPLLEEAIRTGGAR